MARVVAWRGMRTREVAAIVPVVACSDGDRIVVVYFGHLEGAPVQLTAPSFQITAPPRPLRHPQ